MTGRRIRGASRSWGREHDTRAANGGGHELVRRARLPCDPFARQGDHGVRRRHDDLRGDGDPLGRLGQRPVRAWRRLRRCRGAPLVQLPGVLGDDLRRKLPRRHRDADQLAAGPARSPVHTRARRSSCARVRRDTPQSRERRHEGHANPDRSSLHLLGGSGRLGNPRRSARPLVRWRPCPWRPTTSTA